MPTSIAIEDHPGLSEAWILDNLGGNRDLMIMLARLFLEQHAADIPLIEAALAGRDWPLARQLVHTLGGTAGNLGALRVHHEARAFAAVLSADPAASATVPPALSEAMDELLPSLRSLAAVR